MHVGLVCDGIWSDYDGDGWQDLIIAGEFSDIKILKNAHGRLTPLQQTGLEGYIRHLDFFGQWRF